MLFLAPVGPLLSFNRFRRVPQRISRPLRLEASLLAGPPSLPPPLLPPLLLPSPAPPCAASPSPAPPCVAPPSPAPPSAAPPFLAPLALLPPPLLPLVLLPPPLLPLALPPPSPAPPCATPPSLAPRCSAPPSPAPPCDAPPSPAPPCAASPPPPPPCSPLCCSPLLCSPLLVTHFPSRNSGGVSHGGMQHGGMQQQAHAHPLPVPARGFEYGEEEEEGAGAGGFTLESVRSLLEALELEAAEESKHALSVRSLLEALELEAAEESKHALSIVDRVLWVDKRSATTLTRTSTPLPPSSPSPLLFPMAASWTGCCGWTSAATNAPAPSQRNYPNQDLHPSLFLLSYPPSLSHGSIVDWVLWVDKRSYQLSCSLYPPPRPSPHGIIVDRVLWVDKCSAATLTRTSPPPSLARSPHGSIVDRVLWVEWRSAITNPSYPAPRPTTPSPSSFSWQHRGPRAVGGQANSPAPSHRWGASIAGTGGEWLSDIIHASLLLSSPLLPHSSLQIFLRHRISGAPVVEAPYRQTVLSEWEPPADRRLSPAAAESMTAEWSEEEVKSAFQSMTKNKAPGRDGLPKELFEVHWDILGEHFMSLVKSFSDTASLPASTKDAVTILLHKKGGRDQLENYRPITLLSFTYKVIARVVADRMKKGCLLAPYLFLCAVEPLAQEAANRKIGISAGDQRLAYLGYADDTTLILKGEEEIAAAEKLLEEFAGESGLATNKEKSVVLPLGSNLGKQPWKTDGFK
ncbi:unnamed protein product [Closterium sp. Yama58-4]|nr:unnamed protein product [Closterium sp. Yama58-4]